MNSFRRGSAIALSLDVDRIGSASVTAAELRYRRMDQSEIYVEVEMVRENGCFVATVPGGYSDSPYALQSFFVLRDGRDAAWLFPGLDADLSNQPYYVIREERHLRTWPFQT